MHLLDVSAAKASLAKGKCPHPSLSAQLTTAKSFPLPATQLNVPRASETVYFLPAAYPPAAVLMHPRRL